ncbi:MAG TPA: ABC transporter ATP-binding protein [Stellaceae bacterium]|nr:ABC transporter ATP-binding protein [Stellaceae bacterium]
MPTAAADGIIIRNLEKNFVVDGLVLRALSIADLTVREGEFLCIVGPSGCGKTTLLRILGGLETPTAGSVECLIRPGDRPLQSMVFQEQGVFPWLTVLGNAAFGLTVRGVAKPTREAVARDYLRKLGLAAFERAYPRQLSGGMRQRVNLARAFANDPAILLMDEPLGAIDEQTKMLVQEDLLHLWEGSRKTVIFITHSLDEAIVLGDRVAVMSHRPGRIKAVYDVGLPRPRNALELRNHPDFVAMRSLVWDALREEVLSGNAGSPEASP